MWKIRIHKLRTTQYNTKQECMTYEAKILQIDKYIKDLQKCATSKAIEISYNGTKKERLKDVIDMHI